MGGPSRAVAVDEDLVPEFEDHQGHDLLQGHELAGLHPFEQVAHIDGVEVTALAQLPFVEGALDQPPGSIAGLVAQMIATAPETAAAIVSAPLDLTAASGNLEHGLSKALYAPYFLKSLLPKVAATRAHFPHIDHAAVQAAQSLMAFDNAFTAPVHGFPDAAQYYRLASAKPLLKSITVPTLILNARNDPFMPAAALPTAADVSAAVTLLQPAQGGHAGFPARQHLNWLPDTLLQYFELVTPA